MRHLPAPPNAIQQRPPPLATARLPAADAQPGEYGGHYVGQADCTRLLLFRGFASAGMHPALAAAATFQSANFAPVIGHTGTALRVSVAPVQLQVTSIPLTRLAEWLKEIAPGDREPLFTNRHGLPLSRSGVEDRLQRAVCAAADQCPSLNGKNVSPHTLRHTTAMHLLQAGVDEQ